MKPIHLQKTYLKRPETKDERVFNGDDPKENKAFFTALKADEKERIVSNKQSIEYFEKTLYKYSEILACEVKSKKNARELKELVIDRLRALQVFKSNDEFSKKYNELILFGKSLLSQIETMIIDLPDDKEPFDESAIEGCYKYNRNNENYLFDYLNQIYNSPDIDLKNKTTLGAVCLILHEWKTITCKYYTQTLIALSKYWRVEPPKDKRPNKYEVEAQRLKQNYLIFNKKPD